MQNVSQIHGVKTRLLVEGTRAAIPKENRVSEPEGDRLVDRVGEDEKSGSRAPLCYVKPAIQGNRF